MAIGIYLRSINWRWLRWQMFRAYALIVAGLMVWSLIDLNPERAGLWLSLFGIGLLVAFPTLIWDKDEDMPKSLFDKLPN